MALHQLEDVTMTRKRHTAEEIVAKLRQVDVLTAQGRSVAEAVRAIGVTEVTYYRWRSEYGGLKQGRRMRSAGDQRGHEGVVPGGGFALALEAGFQRGVGASKVERNLAEQGQVPDRVALAYAARVFVEPDVEYPMQPVLDRPMASDGGGELCRR